MSTEIKQNLKDLRLVVAPNFKVHYAPYGEWGGERVNCGRFYTTDVAHTWNKDDVTCKFCQAFFKNRKAQ